MKRKQWNARAARSLMLSSAAALTLLLGACGNDDGDDGDGGGDTPGGGSVSLGNADLSSPQAVQAQVGTLGQLLTTISTLDAVATPVPTAAARSIAKAGEACPDGGEFQDVAEASKNVGSPFTNQAMPVSGTRAVNCTYANRQSQGGQNIEYSVKLNGLSEAGGIEDAGSVLYASVGEGANAPFEYEFDVKTSGSAGGQNFSSQTELDFDGGYRLDSKSTNSGSDSRFSLLLDGDYETSASSGGQGGSASGDFTSFIGTSEAPFKIVSASDGVRIEGRYGFGISPVPAGANCTSASLAVETTQPLVPDTGGNGSPYGAGIIKLSSGSTSATVQFNNDGTVTLTPQGGSATTISYAEAVAAAAPCAGFAFAGIAFLGAL